ncbi:MAG: AraC family transcriptional regulator ligand-binding domain-containing protein, partial [Halioglobus sp.]|nr:AraC family transcriptional regulator ligand-binding domain-containing protein [Halioglobus sp.]
MVETSTPAQYVLILIDLVERRGCDRTALLAGTGLARTGIANVGARVSDRDFAIVVANALRLTGDAALGLNLGLHLNLSAHAVLGQAFMT